jgi:uncharacterized CHY-type Zn-finger protein
MTSKRMKFECKKFIISYRIKLEVHHGELKGMQIKGFEVKGSLVDQETRCTHYHTVKDRIAIKFYCCQTYYPCFECHEEHGCGQTATWPKEKYDHKGILCGSCGTELTIGEYLNCQSTCPNCLADFNPGCNLHRHLYFEV